MGSKENLLNAILREDRSGGIKKIHELLTNTYSLKWKGPSNSSTLYYYFRHEGKEIGVAAMRENTFSFPAPFWSSRSSALERAKNLFSKSYFVDLEPAISSSQYSACQIDIKVGNVEKILLAITTVVAPETKKAGAKIA